MGLFSSSKSEPQPQLPFVELRLAHPKEKIFKPGDAIDGNITLTTPITISPQAVEVTLWGRSETWIRTSTTTNNNTTYYHYRDHAPLFTLTSNVPPLMEKGSLFPGETYNMPFSFTMPMGTGFRRGDCYEHPEDPVYKVLPHDLPPTFIHGHHGTERPNCCSVSYGVTARLICTSLGAGKYDIDPLACTAPILFAPLNPYAHILTPNRVRSSKRFALCSSALAGHATQSIGFRQSIKDKLSSQTPKLDFMLAVELPDLCRSGSEFSFKASFVVLEKTENVVRIPEMTFRVLKLELIDFTLFRAPRDWQANSMMSGAPSKYRDSTPRSSFRASDQNSFGEEKTLLNSVPEFGTIELPEVLAEKSEKSEKKMEQGSECEVWFTGRVPGYTPPSFQSFAITRTYRIRVKIGVEIGGKEFDYVVEGTETNMGSA